MLKRSILGWVLAGAVLLPQPLFAQRADDDADGRRQPAGRRNAGDNRADDDRADDGARDNNSNADGGSERASKEPMDLNLSGADLKVEVVGDNVVIYGLEDDLDIVEELMNRLDGEYQPQGYRVLKLQSKNAQNIASVVQQAATKLRGPSPRPDEEIAVQTIANNILLTGGRGRGSSDEPYRAPSGGGGGGGGRDQGRQPSAPPAGKLTVISATP